MTVSTDATPMTSQAHSRLRNELDELRRLCDFARLPETFNEVESASLLNTELNDRIRRIHDLLQNAVVGDSSPDGGIAEAVTLLKRWKRFYPIAEAAAITGRGDDHPALTCQLVDVAIRLRDRFSPDISFAEILSVIDRCRRDLDIATPASLPELVERLAAQRLLDTTTRGPFPVAGRRE